MFVKKIDYFCKNEFTPGRGVWFANDTLRILTEKNITVIRPWGTKAGAWRKTAKSCGWKAFRPKISFDSNLARLSGSCSYEIIKTDEGYTSTNQLIFPFREMEKANSWKQFFNCIPDPAIKQIRQFSSRQWHILQTLNRCGTPAFDLSDCPILLFLIANNWVFGTKTTKVQRTARRLCRLKRRKAAAWLDFPDREMTINIFRKVALKSISIDFCFYLRNAMNDENTRQYLMHVPKVNRGVLRLLGPDTFPFLTPTLLTDAEIYRTEDVKPCTAYKLLDIIRIINLLRPDIEKFPRFKSCLHVDTEHKLWIEQLNKVGYSIYETRFLNLDFPSPPDFWLPDSNILSIEPIVNPKYLIDMGREQNNCVSSWAHKIVKGDCYIYRVRQGDKIATLAIHKTKSRWKILDIKYSENTDVTSKTLYLVKEWLALAQGTSTSMNQRDFYDDDIPI